MSRELSTVVTGMAYLECPRWHDQRIWFSDFYTYRVYSAAEDGSDVRIEAEVPQQPSGLGWLPDGRLLIVSMRDACVLRREADGTLVCHADVSGYVGGLLNDMVVDSQGRAGFDIAGDGTLTNRRTWESSGNCPPRGNHRRIRLRARRRRWPHLVRLHRTGLRRGGSQERSRSQPGGRSRGHPRRGPALTIAAVASYPYDG
jgi:sugar lactone lactonase YvrE